MSGFVLILLLLVGTVVGGLILVLKANSPKNDNPDDNSFGNLDSLDDSDRIIDLAKEHESNHQWSRAREAWSRLIEQEPDRTEAYFRRGLVAYRLEDYQQAAEDFQRVMEENDDHPAELFLHTARCHLELDEPDRAFSCYQEYYEQGDPSDEVIKEMANLARRLERWSQARQYYEYLKEHADEPLATDAELALANIALERDLLDRVDDEMSSLAGKFEENRLNENQELDYWYLKAKRLDRDDQPEKADRFYRKIYQRNPDYRDVKTIVEDQLANLDADSLVRKFQGMDQASFRDLCERIVEGMNYELVESEMNNPEELTIVAREKSMSLRVTRILFDFKQWQEQAGELAIKEFEFKVVEDRFDRGYFVNPAGYKAGAQNYARGNDKLNLMGPSDVIDHLQDWYLAEA